MKTATLLFLLAFAAAARQPAAAQAATPDAPGGAPLPSASDQEDATLPAMETTPQFFPGTTPMSDKEETGALGDLLPGFVDPLMLPEDRGPSPGSLFPASLWPLPPEAMEAPPELPLTAAVNEGGALPPEAIVPAVAGSAPPVLHDPQGLLSAEAAGELSALLEHSINARGGFGFTLVLLGGAQQVPAGIDFEALLSRWYGRGKGALVVYYAGHPERTVAWFSPTARQDHRGEDLRMVVDLGMKEAARLNPPLQQLQRFCFKTAIRLDRLHRQGDVSPSDEVPTVASAAKPQQSGSMLWWAFAIGAQAAGLAAAAVWWLRRKRAAGRFGELIFLPPQEITARLGAPHTGGYGALLSFGTQPPRQ